MKYPWCEVDNADCPALWGGSCTCRTCKCEANLPNWNGEFTCNHYPVPARYEVSCPNSDEVFYLSEFELKSFDKVCGLCNITYEVSEVK